MEKLQKFEDFNQFENIIEFQNLLNEPPKKVNTNSLANNSKYVPVDDIERQLDMLYSGLWSTEKFEYKVVANEIIGNITLKVFHPVAKVWLTRCGAGSIMIMVSKGKPAVLENKIKNALVSGFPKLKSECIKNAAKSLGVSFGRNLNRKNTNEIKILPEILIEKEEINNVREKLNACETKSDFKKIYGNLTRKQQKNKIIIGCINTAKIKFADEN